MNGIISTGDVAAITGTSRGLGKCLAEHFLRRGYKVIGCSRDMQTINHENYTHYIVDVSNESNVKSWVFSIKNIFGRIDLLICNAGLVRSTLLLGVTPSSEMEAIVKTNYIGVFNVLREISKMMILRRSGKIITISSTMTLLHEEGTSVYSATKAAVNETTKVLAKELAPFGITCNVISPAMMWTESSMALAEHGDWKRRMLNKQTFPRLIQAEEVCHVADFFASANSNSITGQVIHLGMVS